MAGTVVSNFTGYLHTLDGPNEYVIDGQEFPADHDLVVTHPHYFEDAEEYAKYHRVDITTYADMGGTKTTKGRLKVEREVDAPTT